jgi:hypothetical protein
MMLKVPLMLLYKRKEGAWCVGLADINSCLFGWEAD